MARLISHSDPTCFVYNDRKNGSVIIAQLSMISRFYLTRNFAPSTEQLLIRCLVLNAIFLQFDRQSRTTIPIFTLLLSKSESSSATATVLNYWVIFDRVSIGSHGQYSGIRFCDKATFSATCRSDIPVNRIEMEAPRFIPFECERADIGLSWY